MVGTWNASSGLKQLLPLKLKQLLPPKLKQLLPAQLLTCSFCNSPRRCSGCSSSGASCRSAFLSCSDISQPALLILHSGMPCTRRPLVAARGSPARCSTRKRQKQLKQPWAGRPPSKRQAQWLDAFPGRAGADVATNLASSTMMRIAGNGRTMNRPMRGARG